MTDSGLPPRSLRWRCRRGMRELDVLLGRWLDDRWETASASLRLSFEEILGREDDEIWDWLMGRECPETSLEPLIDDIREHCVGPRCQ